MSAAAEKEQVEGDESLDGAEGGSKIAGKKRMIILIGAAIVVLVGVGAGLFFSGILGGKKEEVKEVAAAPSGPIFYDLPEFIVNLNTGGKQVSFLKLKVTLELAKDTDAPIIEQQLPRVTDSFNTYLRELRASDLSGSAGMYRLKDELLLRLSKTIEGAQVKDILFKDVLIQ